MARQFKEKRSFRGLLQSEDGYIAKLLKSDNQKIVFEAVYQLSEELISRLKNQPEHLLDRHTGVGGSWGTLFPSDHGDHFFPHF